MSVRRPLFSVLWLLPLGWLWFVLINDLRVEWTVNPQYGYCWAVPFLCVYLAFRKISDLRPQPSGLKSPVSGLCPSSSALRPPWTVVSSLVVLCLAYAPTRLIQEANPGWRLVSWALAIEVIGITFCVLRLALAGDSGQSSVARRPSSALRPPFSAFRFLASAFQLFSFSAFVFPLCFFPAAVRQTSGVWPCAKCRAVRPGFQRKKITCQARLFSPHAALRPSS